MKNAIEKEKEMQWRIRSFLRHEYPWFCGPLCTTARMETDPILQEKLQQLETMISKMMYATLEQEPSTSIYIDIQKKPAWEDVSFFLLKTFAKQFGCSEEQLTQYLQEYSTHISQPFTLDEYQTFLLKYITKRQQERPERTDIKDIILADEGIDYFCIMEKILEQQKKNTVFLLFDHIDTLTKNEQQQINNLIATRWALGRKGKIWAYPKINNARLWRKIYMNTQKHPIQSPHDYVSHFIPLEVL